VDVDQSERHHSSSRLPCQLIFAVYAALAFVRLGSSSIFRSLGGLTCFASLRALEKGRLVRAEVITRRAQGSAWRSWQKRLDKALLDVDAIPQARSRNLRKAFEDPAAILRDINTAIAAVADKGFAKGHPEAIDALWPKGTMARSDLEALQALRKQVPELLEDFAGSLEREDRNRGESPQPARPGLGELLAGLSSLATDAEKRDEAVEEAKNIFRQTPKGLEQPKYKVVSKLEDGAELREYQPFTVAQTTMSGSGADARRAYSSAEGFNSLAGYLFGKNSRKEAMAMTMPVEISFGDASDANMSFVMPAAVDGASNAPVPDDGAVTVREVPARLVAVVPFPGVATAGEVDRQRQKLLGALGAYEPLDAEQYTVLQYNPPYTLPWRRRNEIAIVVQRVPDVPSGNESAPAA